MDPRASEPALWKTQQVAELLRMSVSTVKRLVDSGELRAARTAGGHRLIPREEAIRYAQQRNLPLSRVEWASPSTGGTAGAGTSPETLAAALRRGRAEEARGLILSTYGSGGAVRLADELIRPAMEHVGHDWESGALDVFQEHRATRIVEAALMDLIGRMPSLLLLRHSEGGTPLALGAGPEGDPYTIAGLLCELALREQGWDVMNLGPNLPMASLAKAVLAHQPRLVWITVSHLIDPDRFASEYAHFYHAASKTGAAVILGGQALGPGLRSRLVSAGFGERVAHLVELARTLFPPRTPGRTDGEGRPTERPGPEPPTNFQP